MLLNGDHLKGFVDNVRVFETEICLSRGRFLAQRQHSKETEYLNQEGLCRERHTYSRHA